MKKRLLILALLVISGFALFACGDTIVNGEQGAKGDQGVDGKSAYQIAVERGLVGSATSEDEWYDSLTGQRGTEGEKGQAGKNAKNGTQYEITVNELGDIYEGVVGEEPKLIALGNGLNPILVDGKTMVDGADFDAIASTGVLPEGEIIFVGTCFKDGNFTCFATGSRFTVEFKDAVFAEGVTLEAEKNYIVIAKVESLNFPFIKISYVAAYETEREVPEVEREVAATTESQGLMVFKMDEKWYAAVAVANKYSIVVEVTVEEGKVVNATKDLFWDIAAVEGGYNISANGTFIGTSSSNSYAFGATATEAAYVWTIGEDGLIKNNTNNARTICYNPGSPRVVSYKYNPDNNTQGFIPVQFLPAIVK